MAIFAFPLLYNRSTAQIFVVPAMQIVLAVMHISVWHCIKNCMAHLPAGPGWGTGAAYMIHPDHSL